MKIKRYQNFILENLNQAKSIMQKKMDDYERLKVLLNKNLGYMGKFTQFLMEENIPYKELENLFNDLIEIKSKNSSFDINGMKYEKVLDKLQDVKEDISIKYLINQFPGDQKSLLKKILGDYNRDKIRNALYKISQKDNKSFISKISRYKNESDLEHALTIFSKDSLDDKDSVLKQIEKMKSNVVIDKDNLMILRIEEYEDIKVLGSNTSWCIVQSEHTYNSYVKGRYQFVLYNYNLDDCDVDFKIGFTLNKDLSIHACHNILDHSVTLKLRTLLNDHDIKMESLIPKKDPLIYDLNKLTSKLNNSMILQICEECKLDEIPLVIQKLLSPAFKSKSKLFIGSCMKSLCNRYYADRKFILESDLDKISPHLSKYLVASKNWVSNRLVRKYYDHRVFQGDNEEVLSKSIDILPDTEICKIEDDVFNNIYRYNPYNLNQYNTEPKFSIELITKISDKINQAYKNINSINDYAPEVKNTNLYGFKLLKETELVMLLFNIALGREESTPDHDNIIKHISNYSKYRYAQFLKLPIDLGEVNSSDITDQVISLVIKKDYTDKSFYISKENYAQCLKLIDHLEGYKVTFRISMKFLKEQYRYQKDDIINRIIKKFKISKISIDEIHSEGNVSIYSI